MMLPILVLGSELMNKFLLIDRSYSDSPEVAADLYFLWFADAH